MTAVAALVPTGTCVADVGTDHGYVPIFLVEQGIVGKAVAMDVNRGPLERARIHITEKGLSDRIETRLSDGLKKLNVGEVDTIIAAGMGGGLIIRILEEGREIVNSAKVCILQPQAEIAKVRKYLQTQGLAIEREDMVEEDGKYYPMMRAIHGQGECYEEYEYLYGKELLKMRHPVLKKYHLREQWLKESVIRKISNHSESNRTKGRLDELKRELIYIRQALACYEQGGPGEEIKIR